MVGVRHFTWMIALALLAASAAPAHAQNIAVAIQNCNDDSLETPERITACETVIVSERTPDPMPFYLMQGYLLVEEMREAEAVAVFDRLIEIAPDEAETYFSIAATLHATESPGLSLAYYDDVIARFPDEAAAALNNKAWLLATAKDEALRDGALAVEAALAAVAEEDNASYRDTLAAAYAEAGDFVRAAEEQEKAIARLEEEGPVPPVIREEMQARLDMFRRGEPYRE
jgi:tetratricopeptide (TPR) repeat protein